MVSYIYISVHLSLVEDLSMFKSQLHFLFFLYFLYPFNGLFLIGL